MRIAVLLALVSSAIMQVLPGREPGEGPVWFWFATCGGPMMTLEVVFDKTTLYKTSFPICHAERGSVSRQGQTDSRIEFAFRPRRTIKWDGYAERTLTTNASQLIIGNIWEAGADPDRLILGVSFAGANRLYMNTLHIAEPNTRMSEEIAPGLTIATYPAPIR